MILRLRRWGLINNRLQLLRYFQDYASRAHAALSRLATRDSKTTDLALAQQARLLEAVERLESQPAFRELVEATRDAYRDDGHDSSLFYGGWESAIGNFFRRSGYYLDCAEEGKIPDYEKLFQQYCRAFMAREVKATYLVPLEGVHLMEPSGKDLTPRRHLIEYNDFVIRRFSRDELEHLSGNRVSRVFYPYAVWDTQKLSCYLYMVISNSKPISGIGKIILDFSGLYKIKRRPAPDWLAPFQMALYRLVLYDWLPKGFSLDRRELHDAWPEELEGFCWSDTGIRFSVERLIQNERHLTWVPWHGFRLPFRLECDGNLIEPPHAAPDTSVLEVEPVGGPEDKEMERPVIWFELYRKATAGLERLSRENFSIINTKLLETWPFFRVALDYLLKAFLTDPYQSPTEQLLWHVTAIEALLGKTNDEKLTDSLARVP